MHIHEMMLEAVQAPAGGSTCLPLPSASSSPPPKRRKTSHPGGDSQQVTVADFASTGGALPVCLMSVHRVGKLLMNRPVRENSGFITFFFLSYLQ